MQASDQVPGRRDEQFSALMQAYAAEILRLCFFYMKEKTAAEDAMQETFLKAYRGLSGLKDEEQAKPWLIKIAVNTCRDALKSAWLRHTDRRVTPEELPEASAEFSPKDDSVVREVMKLKQTQREVILLRFYQELSPEDCCAALGLTRSGFYRRQKRALNTLKKRLEGWDFDV